MQGRCSASSYPELFLPRTVCLCLLTIFLPSDLKPSRWWFFPAALLEKVAFAGIVVFLAEEPTRRYTSELMLTVGSAISLAGLAPYSGWYQALILFSRLVIFLTVFGAILLRMEELAACHPDGSGYCKETSPDSPSVSDGGGVMVSTTALGIALIVLNLVVVLVPCGFVASWACKDPRCHNCCRRRPADSVALREILLPGGAHDHDKDDHLSDAHDAQRGYTPPTNN